MSEITDMFYDECADRKRTARGSFNKRTHNGKRGGVKFPSDYLSKKEKNKMNGEIKVYKMNEPITYAEFKEYPDDLKKQYVNNLREKFDVSDTAIAEMMGVNNKTLNKLLNIIHASGGRRGNRRADFEGFEKWKNAHDAACTSVDNEDADEYARLGKEILEEDRDRRESNHRDIESNYRDIIERNANDPVNHPSHYTAGGIECIDAIASAICMYNRPIDAWLAGQVIKYLWRAPLKGKYAEDIRKAQFYLNRLVNGLEAKTNGET